MKNKEKGNMRKRKVLENRGNRQRRKMKILLKKGGYFVKTGEKEANEVKGGKCEKRGVP